jgi:hypothetical protein
MRIAAPQAVSIDWGAFGLVVVAALAASLMIVVFFSVALRLLAIGSSAGPDRDSASEQRQPLATVGAVACVAICIAAVLYGLYLVIPAFH